MSSKMASAVKILQQEGPIPLIKKVSLFLTRQSDTGRSLLYNRSLKQVKERMREEKGLDDILDTVLDINPGYTPYAIGAIQLRDEIKTLTTLLEREQLKNVLEIGTCNGGSFYIWSRYLSSVKLITSLDLPGGRFGGGYEEQKTNIFREFAPSKEMHFIRDNSHNKNTCDAVSELFDDGVDFLFIDGDHTYEGVKQDFEMYSELVNEGGIIALHDIVTHPDNEEVVQSRKKDVENIEERHLTWSEAHPDCNVDQLWDELIERYETEEIISHPKQTWGGIGIVRV